MPNIRLCFTNVDIVRTVPAVFLTIGAVVHHLWLKDIY